MKFKDIFHEVVDVMVREHGYAILFMFSSLDVDFSCCLSSICYTTNVIYEIHQLFVFLKVKLHRYRLIIYRPLGQLTIGISHLTIGIGR